MATRTVIRKQQSAAATIEPEVEIEQPDLPETTPDDVAVMDLLEELGSDANASVRIYRQGKGGYRDIELLGEVSVSEFTPIMLAHPPYNGGVFRIHAKSKGGFLCNRELKVAGAPQPAQPAAVQAPPAITLEAVSQIVAQAIAAAIPKAPPGPTRKEMLEEMSMMAAMFKPATPVAAGGGMMEQLSTFKVFADLVKSMAPPAIPTTGDGGIDTTGLIISKGVDMLASAMHARQQQQTPPQFPNGAQPVATVEQLPAPPAPPQVELPPANPALSPEEQEQADMISMLKLQLKMANGMALKDANPAEVADSIYDEIPDDLFESMTQAPDWFSHIVALEPGCATYQSWYGKVRDEVIRIAKETGDLTPDGKVPDNPHLDGNAAVIGAGRGEPETAQHGTTGSVVSIAGKPAT